MQSTKQLGDHAEDQAARLLRARGYEIIERNFRCSSGELDLIARHAGQLVFVEVRSRADDEHGDAAATIDRRKQYRVARVAAHYLAVRAPEDDQIRFDVVAITGDRVELYQDAFRLGALR